MSGPGGLIGLRTGPPAPSTPASTERALARTKRYVSEQEELRRWRSGLDTALRKRRSVGRTLLKWVAITLAVALVSATATAAYFWKDIERRIKRTDVSVSPVQGGIQNILVIGTDSRAFVESPEDVRRFGRDQGGQRADTIILVQAVPGERRAVLLAFPRDLWVPVAGDGTGKINSSFQRGADSVIQTVEQLSGIPINHYIQVDFNGFRHLVDAVGGIDVCLDRPMRDTELQFRLPAGVSHLDGNAALTFVRSRYADPDGDFGRIRRQQQFLRSVIAELGRPSVLLNPLRVHELAAAFASNVTTDRDFKLTDLARVARQVRSVRPEMMETFTVPGGVGRAGGQSVVLLDRTKADPLFQALRDHADPQKATGPGPVQVVVDDASGRGLVDSVSAELAQQGFQVTRSQAASGVQASTTVIAPRTLANDAQRLVAVVPGARLLFGGTEIHLVVGRDFKGVAKPPQGNAPQPGGPCAGFQPG